jgi:hypothetical protein
MQTSTKSSAKSCSCSHCRAGKATKCGKYLMLCDQRANRRFIKTLLKRAVATDETCEDDILLVPKGNYYD